MQMTYNNNDVLHLCMQELLQTHCPFSTAVRQKLTAKDRRSARAALTRPDDLKSLTTSNLGCEFIAAVWSKTEW